MQPSGSPEINPPRTPGVPWITPPIPWLWQHPRRGWNSPIPTPGAGGVSQHGPKLRGDSAGDSRGWHGRFPCGRLQTLLPVEIFHPGRLFGMPLVPAARAVAVLGDLGFLDARWPPREPGAPLTPHPPPHSQYDRASWSDPSLLQEFLAFPAEGRGSWGAWGWDLVAPDPLPINSLGTGGGKSPSPHQGRVWGVPGGFWALFPAISLLLL